MQSLYTVPSPERTSHPHAHLYIYACIRIHTCIRMHVHTYYTQCRDPKERHIRMHTYTYTHVYVHMIQYALTIHSAKSRKNVTSAINSTRFQQRIGAMEMTHGAIIVSNWSNVYMCVCVCVCLNVYISKNRRDGNDARRNHSFQLVKCIYVCVCVCVCECIYIKE